MFERFFIIFMQNKFYMKRLFSFLFLMSITIVFVSCSKLRNPELIVFEKQKIVSNYDWKIISPNGESQNFITKTNKVIFVYYWSVNDEENLDNLDRLEKFYKKFNTKVEFIFLTQDSQAQVRDFIKSNEYTFPVFFSLSPIPNPMKMDNYSNAYLISKKGRVVISDTGKVNWNSDLFYEIVNGLIKQ